MLEWVKNDGMGGAFSMHGKHLAGNSRGRRRLEKQVITKMKLREIGCEI
jgi:hypothetical protein